MTTPADARAGMKRSIFLLSGQTHLLLGGAGFIGRHVAAALLSSDCAVIIADRAATNGVLAGTAHVRYVTTDFMTADWDALIAHVDVVHYYAWASLPATGNANPLGDLQTNVGALLGLLEAMRRRGHGRVVFSSSGGTVYGRTTVTPIPESHPLTPVTAYGAGKAAAELYLGLYRDLYGLDCRIARIANPFGAGQDVARGQGAIMTFIQKAMRDEEVVIWGDGRVTRDYIHVSDVAQAMVKLATLPEFDRAPIFNIGSGQGLSLNDVLRVLEQRLGRRISVKRDVARTFDVPVNVLDISNAAAYLDWQPRLSFEQAIDVTMSHCCVQAASPTALENFAP